MKYKLVLLLVLLTIGHLQAQWNYVVDVVRGDSTALIQRVNSKNKQYDFVCGDTVGWLHNGDTVTIAVADSGFAKVNASLVTATINGKKYFLDRHHLMYGNNLAGKIDWVNSTEESQQMHTDVGHIYMGGYKVYWVIFGLFLAALLLALVGQSDGLMIIASLVLLAATALEVFGFYYFKNDLLWWLDKALYPFWNRMLYVFLLVVAIGAQFWTMQLISEKMGSGGISVWIPGAALLAAGIIDFLATLILGFCHVSGNVESIVSLVAFAALGLIAFVIVIFVNVREIGGLWGTIISLFSMLWGFGVVASVVLLVVAILKVFWAIILVAIGVFYVFSSSNRANSDGMLERSRKESSERSERERKAAEERRRRELQAENDRINRQRTEERFERYKRGGM